MNHINLSVPDVQATRGFFEKYFSLHFMGSPKSDRIIAALDENDNIITLSNFSGASEYHYPAAFHVGFNLPSRDDVDAMHERLTSDDLKPGKRADVHMSWSFYVEAPGGFLVEVFYQMGMEQMKAAAAKLASSTSGSSTSAALP